MEDPNALNIYTDGSSVPNPRQGGIGMVFVFPECLGKEPKLICPYGYKKATNNQMELLACKVALEESLKMERKWQQIVIYTDSMYVIDGYLRAFTWMKNQWTKFGGAPVANINEWKALLRTVRKVGVRVNFSKVKGHADNEYNNIADKLARQSSKKATLSPLYNINLRRKLSSKKTEEGSVKMSGQRLKIRIITSTPQPNKPTRYRYEVLSKKSPFFCFVDILYSTQVMRVGHEFSVRLNSDQRFPQVIKIYKDHTKEKQTIGSSQINIAPP